MKKLFSFLLVLALLCTASASLSDTITAGEMEVSLFIDRAADSYIVTIPAAVEIDPISKSGSATLTLKKDWQLISCNRLYVRLTEAAGGISDDYVYKAVTSTITDEYILHSPYSANFTMLYSNTTGSFRCPYAIKASNAYYPFSGSTARSGSVNGINCYTHVYTHDLLSAVRGEDNSEDQTCDLVFYVPTMPTEPGTYTDTLTFSIILQ